MKQQSQFSHRFPPNSPSLVRCPQHRHSDPRGSSCCGQQPRYSRNARLQERAPNSSHCRELRGHLDPTRTWNKPFFLGIFLRRSDAKRRRQEQEMLPGSGREVKKKKKKVVALQEVGATWQPITQQEEEPHRRAASLQTTAWHGTPRTRLFCKIKSF